MVRGHSRQAHLEEPPMPPPFVQLGILVFAAIVGVLVGLAHSYAERWCPYCHLEVSRLASTCPHCRCRLD
jgi:hypothetical protein